MGGSGRRSGVSMDLAVSGLPLQHRALHLPTYAPPPFGDGALGPGLSSFEGGHTTRRLADPPYGDREQHDTHTTTARSGHLPWASLQHIAKIPKIANLLFHGRRPNRLRCVVMRAARLVTWLSSRCMCSSSLHRH